MKLTPFDFLPWMRPYADRWPWIVRNQMAGLLAAGGYRMKLAATASDPNLGGDGAASVDYYLNVVPGSYCWAVGAYDDPTDAFPTIQEPNVQVGQCATEFEIIDTSTRETWFESSLDSVGLGFMSFNDNSTVHDSGLAVDVTEQMGYYSNMWMLQEPRLCLGNGVQRVRVTQNSSSSIDELRGGIVLWLLEPINAGVMGGL